VNTGVIVRKEGVKLNPLESQAAFVRVQELENQMHNEKRKNKRLRNSCDVNNNVTITDISSGDCGDDDSE
jgi:hypothetical protein